MKIVHAVIALILSVLLVGLITSLASANVPGVTATVGRSLDVYAAAPMKPGDTSGMPRVSAIATPTPVSGTGLKSPSATVKPSPTKKYLEVKPLATMKASPTVKATMKASPKPTTAVKYLKMKPSATVKASPTVKYLQAKPVATAKASPTVRASPKTPAQSYGVFGLGGPVPSPPKATVTARPVPSGSPTPVPGGFTPRYPGEPGYSKSSPTPAAVKNPPTWPKR